MIRLPLAGVLLLGLIPAIVRGQDRPSATVLHTSAVGGVDHGVADAMDRLVRARVDELEVLSVTGSSALNLEDMQLAVGCVGETDACLGAVASQAGVQVLVLPSVTQAGDQMVVSVTVYDAHQTPPTRRAVQRLPAGDAASRVLETVPALLAQLFPDAAAAHPTTGGSPPHDGGDDGGAATPPPPHHHEMSPLPIVVLAIGAVALAVGVGFGVATGGANDAYGMAPTTTHAEVDAAFAHLDEAGTDAAVADVMFVVGGLLVAGGLAWLAVDLLSGDDPHDRRASRLRLAPGPLRGGGFLSLSGDL